MHSAVLEGSGRILRRSRSLGVACLRTGVQDVILSFRPDVRTLSRVMGAVILLQRCRSEYDAVYKASYHMLHFLLEHSVHSARYARPRPSKPIELFWQVETPALHLNRPKTSHEPFPTKWYKRYPIHPSPLQDRCTILVVGSTQRHPTHISRRTRCATV